MARAKIPLMVMLDNEDTLFIDIDNDCTIFDTSYALTSSEQKVVNEFLILKAKILKELNYS